jgi:hypothetical protein
MLPGYPLILAVGSADGAALTNSLTATSILPGSAVATIPAGALQIGSLIKLTLRGRISTLVTAPGTLTLDVRLGAVVISALGALALNVNAQTNASFELELLARVVSLGAGTVATALCMARFSSRAVIGSPAAGVGGAGVLMLPDTAPAVGAGFDSTSAQAVNVFAAWSVASASNSLQVHQALIELKV